MFDERFRFSNIQRYTRKKYEANRGSKKKKKNAGVWYFARMNTDILVHLYVYVPTPTSSVISIS